MKRNYRIKALGGMIISYIMILPIIYRQIMGYDIRAIDIILLLIATILIIIFFVIYLIARKNENEKEVEDYYQNIRSHVIKNIKVNNVNNSSQKQSKEEFSDVLELMAIHLKEIKDYYVLSKSMAKDSFYLAVAMCICGLGIIGASIVAIFLVDISFMEALIPVIGGSVVEVIAGTSLSVYKKSLEQLNQYYESLHSNERYLSLVSLVDRLSEDKRDEVYTNIVNSQLELLKKSLWNNSFKLKGSGYLSITFFSIKLKNNSNEV